MALYPFGVIGNKLDEASHLGVGHLSPGQRSLILADVPVQQSGIASGTQSTARQIGAALGTAVLATVLFVTLGSGTESRVAEIPGVSAEQAQQAQAEHGRAGGVGVDGIDQRPARLHSHSGQRQYAHERHRGLR